MGTSTLRDLAAARYYNASLYRRVSGALGRRVLEIGCGTGTITAFLLERELVVAIDVVDEFVQAVRDRFGDRANMVTLRHDLAQGPGDLARYHLDSAVSVNVFEHIEDDRAAFRAVYELLEPGGTLTVLVPAHPFLMSRLDRAIGHHRRYTRSELRAKLAGAGFRVEKVRRGNFLGALGWLILVKLLGRPQLEGVGLFDSMVPILDRFGWIEPPIGLSLVGTGRKPD